MTDIRDLNYNVLAKNIQFTFASPNATRKDFIKLAELSARYEFNAAMVPMCWVPMLAL